MIENMMQKFSRFFREPASAAPEPSPVSPLAELYTLPHLSEACPECNDVEQYRLELLEFDADLALGELEGFMLLHFGV